MTAKCVHSRAYHTTYSQKLKEGLDADGAKASILYNT